MQLIPVWWQRIVWVAVAAILTFTLPALLGMRGIALVIGGGLFVFPALGISYILVFMVIPLKYVLKREAVMTLFRR